YGIPEILFVRYPRCPDDEVTEYRHLFSFWTLSVNKSGQALIESYHELRIGIFYQFGPDNF
ncbi:hypothetical protein NL511_31005, partial [Klebsiella pneumoniae]|nr:hypothetical protein [Klebsiella pneumoniae]